MSSNENPMTIGERYRRATHTSNMRVEARCTGDADLLIAAGWSDSLGIMLYRLAGEFDQVAADVRKTAANDLTAMVLILMNLKTLKPAKEALGHYAVGMATRERIMLTDKEVKAITGRALSSWLDPNCHKCEGRGMNGGYDGVIQSICRACHGSGKSRSGVGGTVQERQFAAKLMSMMDAKVDRADTMLRKLTSTV